MPVYEYLKKNKLEIFEQNVKLASIFTKSNK